MVSEVHDKMVLEKIVPTMEKEKFKFNKTCYVFCFIMNSVKTVRNIVLKVLFIQFRDIN